MATNLYFSQKVKSEQDLYENIVIESLKMYGQDLLYLPRTIIAQDNVFREDVTSKFEDAYQIEMYLENIDGYAGDGDLFTRFGVEIRDQANFIMSKKRWDETMQDALSSQLRPYEGDLIYIPLTNSIFEITKVEDERPFYQLSNLPVYRLTCELFEYSGEAFNTGQEVDIIETNFAFQTILALSDSATTSLGGSISLDSADMTQYIGELDSSGTITQTLANNVTISGEMVKFEGALYESDGSGNEVLTSPAKLYLANVGADDGLYHTFTAGALNLSTGSLIYATASSENMPDIDNQQNDAFETSGDDFLDFSESNPFGEPT